MKYIIYYFFYITSSVESNITTLLIIEEKSVSFYVYDVGYVKWDIEDKDQDVDSKHTCLAGTYHLKYEDMKALVKVNCEQTIIVIFVEGEVEHITLRKKK